MKLEVMQGFVCYTRHLILGPMGTYSVFLFTDGRGVLKPGMGSILTGMGVEKLITKMIWEAGDYSSRKVQIAPVDQESMSCHGLRREGRDTRTRHARFVAVAV